MFSNIGEKIKTLAEVICIIGIVVSIIAAIVMFSNSEIGLGFLLLILAPLLFWISSFTLYGFGEIIVLLKQNIDKQTEIIKKLDNKPDFVRETAKEEPINELQDIEANLPQIWGVCYEWKIWNLI